MPLLSRALVGLLLAAATVLPTGAAAAAPSPSPDAASAVLDAQVREQQEALRQADAALARAVEAADAALQARQQAERAAGLARRAALQAEAELAAARARVAEAKGALAGFAGALYRQGTAGQGMSYLHAALVTDEPGRLLHDVELAEQVGDGQAQAYERFRAAAAAQRTAAQRAQRAREAAAALEGRAGREQALAARAVAAQTDLVALRRQVLARATDAAQAQRRREELLAEAEQVALARSRAGIPLDALAGALVPRPEATCTGGDLSGYPNGLLPEAALCPLWGAPGHALRGDAAAAFVALSRAWAQESGSPLCVTDSYRSLPEQVAVKAAKPDLAAVPGTSNHGWGVAVDLCDGVETFDTPAHRWLREHASGFGWFLPAWAQEDGSKPEPWHWEYAG